jgi:hypothetical protein
MIQAKDMSMSDTSRSRLIPAMPSLIVRGHRSTIETNRGVTIMPEHFFIHGNIRPIEFCNQSSISSILG